MTTFNRPPTYFSYVNVACQTNADVSPSREPYPVVCMKRLILLLALAGSACGSDSPTAPTPPAVTVRTIAVTSSSDLYTIGASERFIATATKSDGTTLTITAGSWGSDSVATASVDSTGLFQAVRSGAVTVFVDFQGARGTRLIRVVPNYQAQWLGSWSETSCTESGVFAGFCRPGLGGFSLTLTQNRDSVNGSLFVGAFPFSVSGSILQDGSITLTGNGTVASATASLATWRTNVSGTQMTGTFTVNLTSTAGLGFATFGASLVNVFRP